MDAMQHQKATWYDLAPLTDYAIQALEGLKRNIMTRFERAGLHSQPMGEEMAKFMFWHPFPNRMKQRIVRELNPRSEILESAINAGKFAAYNHATDVSRPQVGIASYAVVPDSLLEIERKTLMALGMDMPVAKQDQDEMPFEGR
jgi:hypothetical protein